jgi:hypothetical protein
MSDQTLAAHDPSISRNRAFTTNADPKPHSTHPSREATVVRAVIWIGAALAAAALLSGCVVPETSSSSHSAGGSGQPAPAGSSVRDGKFEFQVVNMTRAPTAGNPSNDFEIAKAQGEFIILTLSVKNIGNEPQSYFGQNQKLIDTNGRH